MHHPNEAILILRGNNKKDTIIVDNVMIPPMAEGGPYYAGFPLDMLPGDMSILGTAHSHPSGSAEPSLTDMNHFSGIIGIIVRYPYEDNDLFTYNLDGEKLEFLIQD
tara:strand:+ start:1706 stop:2026 length:321 start_codon:yes stop_codon:yes gene_type:complete